MKLKRECLVRIDFKIIHNLDNHDTERSKKPLQCKRNQDNIGKNHVVT